MHGLGGHHTLEPVGEVEPNRCDDLGQLGSIGVRAAVLGRAGGRTPVCSVRRGGAAELPLVLLSHGGPVTFDRDASGRTGRAGQGFALAERQTVGHAVCSPIEQTSEFREQGVLFRKLSGVRSDLFHSSCSGDSMMSPASSK